MPSRMTAFVSKHPNMPCSATRGKISLQHPISRGLLPPRRGAECARGSKSVSVFVFACVWVKTWACAHASVCICVCVRVVITLLTTLPLWFIFKRTADSSHTHLSHPSLHSFSPSCSPSSIHLLNTTQSIQPFLTKFISSSIHFSSFHVPIPQSAFTSRRDTQFPQSHWGGRISDLIHPPLVWCAQASEEEVRGSMEDREREAAEAKL